MLGDPLGDPPSSEKSFGGGGGNIYNTDFLSVFYRSSDPFSASLYFYAILVSSLDLCDIVLCKANKHKLIHSFTAGVPRSVTSLSFDCSETTSFVR